MLEMDGIDVCYGRTQVLWNIDIKIGEGQVIAVMGPNGSGKSTVLKSIIGLVRPSSGRILFDGHDITRVPTSEMVGLGIGMVLERRRLFPRMSVRENVLMGAYHARVRPRAQRNLERMGEMFPVLHERRDEPAGNLSGGEQQMVALARALMSEPKLLLMDEPFLGLAPRIVEQIVTMMKRINDDGIAILFNEQNAKLSFSVSDYGYLLESGRIAVAGSGVEMLENQQVKQVYLGY